MGKIILYTNGDGVSVVYPSPNWKGTLTQLAARVVPEGVAYEVVEDTELPSDRAFREAWVRGAGTVNVDMPKAREIHMGRIKVKAAKKIKTVDEDAAANNSKARKARRQSDPVKEQEAEDILDSLADERERLAELAETFDLSGATTPDELTALWPIGL